jgi:sugar phosphate isomerase/epimerase
MKIGIFPRVFPRPTLETLLDAVTEHGMSAAQFNYSNAGLPDFPPEIPSPEVFDRIRNAFDERNIELSAVSGTFNMIDPNPTARREGTELLKTLIRSCPALGTDVVTLCTGSRDPDSMWRRHPDNDSADAWRDLAASLAEVLPVAEEVGVNLAFEPEVSNVIDSAQKGRRIIDEMGSPRLKVVMDGANLFHAGELERMSDILNEAFDLLGGDIVLAHAKDLVRDGEAGNVPAGKGRLDYPLYLSLLLRSGYDGAVILHSLTEADVPGCVVFLNTLLDSTS